MWCRWLVCGSGGHRTHQGGPAAGDRRWKSVRRYSTLYERFVFKPVMKGVNMCVLIGLLSCTAPTLSLDSSCPLEPSKIKMNKPFSIFEGEWHHSSSNRWFYRLLTQKDCVDESSESCGHLGVQRGWLCFRLCGVDQSSNRPLKFKDNRGLFINIMSDELGMCNWNQVCACYTEVPILGLTTFCLNTSVMKKQSRVSALKQVWRDSSTLVVHVRRTVSRVISQVSVTVNSF